MGIRQQDICNRVDGTGAGHCGIGFPIDAFPAKVQCVILGMVRHENFKVEYLAAAMLSAAASALGNTYNIRVKDIGQPTLPFISSWWGGRDSARHRRLKPYSVRSAKGTAGHWRNSRLKWPPIRIQ